jgi:riboflavin kinase
VKKLKPYHIPTLLELVKLGAMQSSVPISTSELGRRLSISQQAASKHLLELEKSDFIQRTRVGSRLAVKITEEGAAALRWYSGELKSALAAEKHEVSFKGKIFQGLGEGAYYVGLHGYRKQFVRLLGFEPYPGTLNVRLASPIEIDQKRQLRFRHGLQVEGFEDSSRTFGPAKCFKAVVNGRAPAGVLVIERTHYDDSVLELISPRNLRKELNLKEDEEVTVDVQL